MAVSDFLFQGNAPPQVSSFSSTTQGFPDWWSAYTQGMIGRANAIAAEPYQAYTGPRVAGTTPDQSSAYALTRGNIGAADPYLAQAGNFYTAGGNASSAAAANPWLTRAGATDTLGLASPLIGQASQTFPGQAASYMSPYTDLVVDRIAQLGGRNLAENLLPGVNDTFTRAGQFGSTRHADITARTLRDVNESILGEQAKALESGYGMAGQLFGQDMSRLGNLAQLTGNLGSETARRYLDIGAQTGALTGTDAARQLAAAQGVGALGTLAQTSGLRDAAALEAIGQTQQAQQQKNLDIAYQNFLEQRGYPRENIAFLNQAIRGITPPTSTTSSASYPASVVGPSPLAQLAGTGATVYGLSQLARGGRVGYAKGGLVRKGRQYKGALQALRAA